MFENTYNELGSNQSMWLFCDSEDLEENYYENTSFLFKLKNAKIAPLMKIENTFQKDFEQSWRIKTESLILNCQTIRKASHQGTTNLLCTGTKHSSEVIIVHFVLQEKTAISSVAFLYVLVQGIQFSE